MAGRVRTHEWSATPLGPIGDWPASLHCAVDTLLSAGFPMIALWGLDLVQIYNDDYRDLMGVKHPAGLGQPTRECWPEVWHINAPIYDRVLAGETVRIEEGLYPITRSGALEAAWFRLSYSPLRDETGVIAGVLVTVIETSEQVLAARDAAAQQTFVLTLSDALRPLGDAERIQREACRLLGAELGMDRVFYAEIDDRECCGRVRSECLGGDAPSMTGRHDYAAFPWVIAELRANRLICLEDAATSRLIPETERPALQAIGVGALLSVPLLKDGTLVGNLTVSDSSPHRWTSSEIAIVKETAERTWAALERTRAQDALRDSEERYRTLFESIDEGFYFAEALFDGGGRCIDILYHDENPAAQRMTNASFKGRRLSAIGDYEPYWRDIFGAVARTGEAQRLERYAEQDGLWYDFFVFKPPTGGPNDLAVVFRDVTERKRAQEELRKSDARQAFLLAVGDALRSRPDVDAKIEIAARHLGERLDASRVLYAEFDRARNVADIFNGWSADGARPFPTKMSPSGHDGEIMDDLKAGRTVRVDDVALVARRPAYAAVAALGVQSLLSVPLIVDGGLKVSISIHRHEPRRWMDDEVALVRDVAERLWAEVVRARAEASLRESEARFQALFSNSPVPSMVLAPNAPDFTVTAANAAYFNATKTTPETLIGHRLFDVFPDDPRRAGQLGSEALAISLYKVLAGQTDAMERVRYDLTTPDGFEPHWWEATNAPMLDASGEITAIIHQVHRVTELHHAEEAERERQQRQVSLLSLSDALRGQTDERQLERVTLDRVAEALSLDRAYITTFDYEKGETIVSAEVRREGLPPLSGTFRHADFPESTRRVNEGTFVVDDVASDASLPDVNRRSFEAFQIGAVIGVGLRKGASDIFWTFAAAMTEPRKWTAGEVQFLEQVAERTWAAVERARAEAALRESEARLRTLADTAPALIWFNDAEGKNIFANQVFADYTGRTAEQIAGKGWHGLVHPEHEAHYIAGYLEAVRAQRSWQDRTRIRRADGAWHWFENHARPLWAADGRYLGHVGVSLDVNEVVKSEQALRTSDERFRQFGEASQDVLWIRDAKTLQWTYLTPAFETIYGLSREEALAGDNFDGWLELIDQEDRDQAIGNIRRVEAGEQVAFEYRVRRPADGAIRWLRNTDFPIRNENGEITLIGGIAHDLTELREAEQRLQALIEGIPQLVWRAGDRGLWTWASPQWTEFTGQSEEDSRGWGWLEALHPDDRKPARDAWSQAVNRGVLEVEYRLRAHGSGAYRWFQTRAVPVRGKAGMIVEWLGTSTDINDLRELHARQEVMVAELQHRTRNLITVVRAVSQQTQRESASLDQFRDRFGDRLTALSRVQGLLSHLSAGQRVTFEELLGSELAALGAPAGKVTLDGPAGVPLRSATVQTFSLALHELATNALKYGALASPQGHLTVRWRATVSADGSPRLQVDWRETGVDMTHVGERPQGGGYGRELIERALPYQLGAKTSYELTLDGVHCTIDVPTSAAQERTGGN